jgi:hypothetical protein
MARTTTRSRNHARVDALNAPGTTQKDLVGAAIDSVGATASLQGMRRSRTVEGVEGSPRMSVASYTRKLTRLQIKYGVVSRRCFGSERRIR